jgi:hypothetical protein
VTWRAPDHSSDRLTLLESVLWLLVLLALCVSGWGCSGEAAPLCAEEWRGWTCTEDCSDCYCDGAVSDGPNHERGECYER